MAGYIKYIKPLLFIFLYLLANASFAEDALAEATPIVKDTYNNSIKTWLYIGEATAAVVTLIFTRNIKTLGAIGAVIIFLNVVAKLAGI